MKVRYLVAAVLAVMLAVAASTASGGTSAATPRRSWSGSRTTRRTVGRRQSPSPIELQAQHPDVQVDVQYQSWGTHLTKLDAALAGGESHDVIEMGNTEMTKYMAAGAFKTLSQAAFPNNDVAAGSKGSCQYNSSSTAFPITPARAVIYRNDQYRRRGSRARPRAWPSSSPTARS